MEDYNADFLTMLETWEAAVAFRGREKKQQLLDTARLLGWLRTAGARSSGPWAKTVRAIDMRVFEILNPSLSEAFFPRPPFSGFG